MLRPSPRRGAGFTLVELVITIALIAILLVMTLPSIGKWNADSHVRAASESLTAAIRLAQATAVAKGRTSLFAMTAAVPPVVTSTPAAAGPNWFAELNVLSGSDETQTTLGTILTSTEGTRHAVTISNGPSVLCFSATGRQTTLAAAKTNLATACTAGDTYYQVSRTGASRSYRVYVYTGGRVRMCDAAKTLSATNPDGC